MTPPDTNTIHIDTDTHPEQWAAMSGTVPRKQYGIRSILSYGC